MIDPRLEHASTLSSRFYRDPSVLQMENRQVFGRTWQDRKSTRLNSSH